MSKYWALLKTRDLLTVILASAAVIMHAAVYAEPPPGYATFSTCKIELATAGTLYKNITLGLATIFAVDWKKSTDTLFCRSKVESFLNELPRVARAVSTDQVKLLSNKEQLLAANVKCSTNVCTYTDTYTTTATVSYGQI